MSEEWRGTLLHLGSSVAVVVLLVAVLAARGVSTQSLLGLRRPRARQVVMWLALFALLIAIEELAAGSFGIPEPVPWDGRYTGWLLALRIIGIVLFAPLSEELVFRGVLFSRIAARLGSYRGDHDSSRNLRPAACSVSRPGDDADPGRWPLLRSGAPSHRLCGGSHRPAWCGQQLCGVPASLRLAQ